MKRKLMLGCALLTLSVLLSMSGVFIDTQARSVAPVVRVGSVQASSGQKEFRPYGFFSSVGPPPAGFENFDTIQYWRREDEQKVSEISERKSGMNETSGVVYRYATISVNRQKFVFTTKKVQGISYKFKGRFLRTDFVDDVLDLTKPVLIGTLTKYKHGRRVAAGNFKLSYFNGT